MEEKVLTSMKQEGEGQHKQQTHMPALLEMWGPARLEHTSGLEVAGGEKQACDDKLHQRVLNIGALWRAQLCMSSTGKDAHGY